MVAGAIRHGTTMRVEGSYVDTHGQSEIGFDVTLLGFDLLPRIKQINKVRPSRPATGQPEAGPQQEMTVLCLQILQAPLVYVNTLMLQDVLAEDDWAELLTPEDRRGLTPLFWQHGFPDGEVKLNMTARLSIRAAASP